MTRVTCKIKDVISEVKSGDWGKDSPTENYTTEVLCVRGADIPELCKGNVGKMPQRFIHNKKATSKILSANNLIIEISGGSPTQSTGRIALISDKILSRYSKPLICSNFCKAITATGIQPEYLFNYWLYLYNKDAMFPYENGTTGIKNLDFNSFIQEQDISIPDIKTQQKIVSILSSIDEKIETNKRINDNLEEQAKALFKSWFVDNNGEKWRKGIVSDFYDISIGKTPPRKESQWFTDSENGIVWASISDMGSCNVFLGNSSEYLTKEAVRKFKVCVVPENTILLSFKLTIGRVAIADKEMATNEAIAHFIAPNNAIEYTYLALKNYEFSSLGSTSSIATAINSKIIKSMPWMMPDEDTLNLFHQIVLPIFERMRNNCQEIICLSSLRDTLLPKLMSGELSVEEVSFD